MANHLLQQPGVENVNRQPLYDLQCMLFMMWVFSVHMANLGSISFFTKQESLKFRSFDGFRVLNKLALGATI